MHFAQPDSGTNHGTSMSIQVGEILGYTTLDHIRLVWETRTSHRRRLAGTVAWSPSYRAGRSATPLRRRAGLLSRASNALKVDAAKLQVRDGAISSTEEPKKKITFAELAKANKESLKQTGRCVHPNSIGRAMNRGVGTCFADVEVDTWTGDWRYVRASYCNDAGST